MTNRIDLDSPTANMFGIEPCPKCKSPYRYMPVMPKGEKQIIACDDCKFVEDLEGSIRGKYDG